MSAATDWMIRKLEDVSLAIARFAGERRASRGRRRAAGEAEPGEITPKTADERTQRRMAEAEHGGVSSAEGTARWERGENPGGLHQKAQRNPKEEPDRMPERERPEREDEPPPRKDRVPGGERHLPATRRGS